MSVEQKETGLNSQNLGELVNQYKQIEQAFNTRIAQIVKSVLPKDFDMSKIRGLDRVFQELNSPQNLRKEGVVTIPVTSSIAAKMLMDEVVEETLKITSETGIFDNGVAVNISKSLDNVLLIFFYLEKETQSNDINSFVDDTSKSVDGILSQTK